MTVHDFNSPPGQAKTCTKCGALLPLEAFWRCARARDGYEAQCKDCKNAYRKSYLQTEAGKRFLASTSAYRAHVGYKRRYAMQEHANAHKAAHGCLLCGQREPVCLDYHHIDPALKYLNISRIINEKKSWPKLRDELEKCILLCANCHRKLHAGLVTVGTLIEARKGV